MPRVALNKKKYKLNDFSKWVKGMLAAEDVSQSELASAIDISQQMLSYKIRTNTFTLKDVLGIFEFFKVPDEQIVQLMKL